jgi:hypothetical protein
MYFLTYTSRATPGPVDMGSLLEKARINNAAHGVTGLLISRSQMFFQLLEGKKDAVLTIFKKIAEDPRHDNLQVLFEVEIEHVSRMFPAWNMGSITDTLGAVEEEAMLDSLKEILKSDRPDREKILRCLKQFSATAAQAPTSAREIVAKAIRRDKAD